MGASTDGRKRARTSDELSYLAFVDGLRAISIIAVVAFHVGVPGFSGGYVGVDVFFVISGFLIINQIMSGLKATHFSIVSFYMRRSLRILPPFLIMLLAVYAAAPFVFPSPNVYRDFTLSAALSPAMLSNVLFFITQGYFDISAEQKPLLHTWTLSVEEQFYLVAPLILLPLFRFGFGRFGKPAFVVALLLLSASLLGCIYYTTSSGRNPAFYLPYLRAWEFIAGGLAATELKITNRLPRWAVEIVGYIGIGLIFLAIVLFNSRMAYPSWRAAVPVAGAALFIRAGLQCQQATVVRVLANRYLVAIGLVSYSWYLWHWPILSYLRIARFGEASLFPDLIGGGFVAFGLASASYLLVERPIRRWRKSIREVIAPRRIVIGGIAACLGMALLGATSGLAGYLTIGAYAESTYAINGRGASDDECRIIITSKIPEHCLNAGMIGLLLGDSHADALFGSFAKNFERMGVRLISMARGGCDPLLFTPNQRLLNKHHGCANLLPPFEHLIASKRLGFVIVTSAWANRNLLSIENLSDLILQFDPSRTRILLIGPTPIFDRPALDCVVLSDWRYHANRERCVRVRSAVEKDRTQIVQQFQATAQRFDNVRSIDPIDLFCGPQTCRPFSGNDVFFWDQGHATTRGGDRVFDGFESDFQWLASGGT